MRPTEGRNGYPGQGWSRVKCFCEAVCTRVVRGSHSALKLMHNVILSSNQNVLSPYRPIATFDTLSVKWREFSSNMCQFGIYWSLVYRMKNGPVNEASMTPTQVAVILFSQS